MIPPITAANDTIINIIHTVFYFEVRSELDNFFLKLTIPQKYERALLDSGEKKILNGVS